MQPHVGERGNHLCLAQKHTENTYLRQIEGGTKVPSLPVFINICNALKISPDYLLRDSLTDNDISKIRELTELWESTPPSQQEIATAMIQAVLERKKD